MATIHEVASQKTRRPNERHWEVALILVKMREQVNEDGFYIDASQTFHRDPDQVTTATEKPRVLQELLANKPYDSATYPIYNPFMLIPAKKQSRGTVESFFMDEVRSLEVAQEYSASSGRAVKTQIQSSDLQGNTNATAFHCSVCPKSFTCKGNLNVHMHVHTRARPYKCKFCHKGFRQHSTLRTHMRIHTGERPYKCKQCHRAFSDYSTYVKHMRVHSGERPYVCCVCSKAFTQSGNLLRHNKVHAQ